jgi:hypothetical protein
MDIDKESSEDELKYKFERLNDSNQSGSEFNISSDSENEEIFENIQNDYIYSGSNITIVDFALSFLALCKKLNIATSSKTILLDYIRTSLPVFNKIPLSYTKLIKNLSFSVVKKSIICKICLESRCDSNDTQKIIEIYEFDIAKQLTCFVNKNWNTICSYKS